MPQTMATVATAVVAHSRPGRASSKSGHVGYAAKAEVKFRAMASAAMALCVATNQLCINKSDGTPVCITGEQLASLLAGNGNGSNQSASGAQQSPGAPPNPPKSVTWISPCRRARKSRRSRHTVPKDYPFFGVEPPPAGLTARNRRSDPDLRSGVDRLSPIAAFSSSLRVSTPLRRSFPERRPTTDRLLSFAIVTSPSDPACFAFGVKLPLLSTLGVTTFLNGTLVSNIVLDTSEVATDTRSHRHS